MPGKEHGRAPFGSADADSVDSLLREAAEIPEPSRHELWQPGLMPGDVLAERFVVERRAASGGMGTIHRGTDRSTSEAVAIKVMASGRLGDVNRFAHEAHVLAELSHPAIVRYVAHGTTPQLSQFLAMEWLEGEDLAERLARAPLDVEQSLSLVRRAAQGVAAAHACGVIHRDLKPSNLFLVNRDPSSVKVLDFGIARQAEGTRTLTQSGTVLGTVGYMSPEQAMGLRDVDARADVFALGCVLFECLTGRAAFVGPNAVAVLAKVLREDPPLVSELRPGLGAPLDALLARLLAKSPAERPKDAGALLRELDELGQAVGAAPPATSMTLTAAEQKIVSVVLGRPRLPRGDQAQTEKPPDGDASHIHELTRRFGTEPVMLRGGGLLVVISGRGAATDQASQAARCALLLGRSRPDLSLAVATGCAETAGRIPVGAAIDRSADLLDRAVRSQVTERTPVAPVTELPAQSHEPSSGIAIDELTAGLLDPGFEVQRNGSQLVLLGEQTNPEATRLLMGKRTPFVGRDKELALLDHTLRECIEDGIARTVLVTGPPGQGKSRLRHEFVARVREQGAARILIARADPVGAGSSFLLVRQLVRQAVGLREGDQAADQHLRLRAYIADLCKGADAARIVDFLAELVGVPATERPSAELRAARNDPQIMSVWLRRSFCEWLSAECAARPLLLVLEDLHWGDLPSVTYMAEALRALATKPLMLVGLARPDVHQAFPDLWTCAERQEIALGRLSARAAERLVREALGQQLAQEAGARIIERADGNAFYLEELIRRVAEGDCEGLPETVLALVQSRLERLEPAARRVLRAASIFGEVFWGGAVAALLRPTGYAGDLDEQLRSLAAHEVIEASQGTRFAGESEYVFRHSLLREAAYGMLTAADRSAGHALVAEWLERSDERDALTLADHFELGGAPKRAVPWLVRAAQLAFHGGDLEATTPLADRAFACGAEGYERGVLRFMRAALMHARGELADSVAVGREALELLPAGSPIWIICAANLFSSGAFLGDQSITGPLLQEILSAPGQPDPSGPYAWAIFNACCGLTVIGELDMARTVLERAEAIQTGASGDDPSFVAGLRITRSYLQLSTGELAKALDNLLEARALSDRIEHVVYQISSRLFLVTTYVELGSAERAESSAVELLARCEPNNAQRFFSDRSAAILALGRLNEGRAEDAIALLRPLIGLADRELAIKARARLAHALVAAGELDAATREASSVLEEAERFPAQRSTALGALGLVALRRGEFEAALAHADRGLDALTIGSWLREGSILRLVRAEALHALGRSDDARAAIHAARDRVLCVAATLEDLELRASYASNVEANARTLRLARAWLEGDGQGDVAGTKS